MEATGTHPGTWAKGYTVSSPEQKGIYNIAHLTEIGKANKNREGSKKAMREMLTSTSTYEFG